MRRFPQRLHEHFDSIQRISDTTTLPSLLPGLRERLHQLIDVDALTARLMAARGAEALTPAEKYAAWQELTVLSACPSPPACVHAARAHAPCERRARRRARAAPRRAAPLQP